MTNELCLANCVALVKQTYFALYCETQIVDNQTIYLYNPTYTVKTLELVSI